MKLAPLLLAAPMVLTMAAADPRVGPERRVLDRWRFARQDESSTAAGGGGGASNTAGNSPTREATSAAAPTTTSAAAETTSTRETPTTSTTPAQQSTTSPTSRAVTSQTPTSAAQTTAAPTSNNAATSNTPVASNTTPTTTSFSLSTPPPSTSVVSTTDHNGQLITSVYVYTLPASNVPATASSTSTSDNQDGGVKKSTVIGLAVTGSIAGLLIILLIVWKLTKNRFSDIEDNDDDAIKWPELNKDSAAMTPIPARPSTRAAGGAETDTLGARDFDSQSAVNSTADLSYQPYSDDPGYGARPQYYDPYGGAPGAAKTYPSPPGSHDGDHKNWGGPADPQYYDAAPRAMSPGPNNIARGMSPGPGMIYDNRVASPAPPNMAYADPVGRTGSPGPAAGGYGYAGGYAQPDPYGGRHSPGPNMAYAQPEMDPYGRRSPGPGMAYGAPGRVGSPGPNAAYR